jgi:pimeloyl-ACP methyl ester carboxylesterase
MGGRARNSYRKSLSSPTAQFSMPDEADRSWKSVDWSKYERDVIVRHRRIRYVDVGSGPVLVLVHGQGGSWAWWLRVLLPMAEEFRVIALDLPGFGASDPIGSGDVIAEQVATLKGLLDHLQLAKAVIVGHSMGGLSTIEMACIHPERVSALVLVDAGGAPIGARRLAWIIRGFRVFNVLFKPTWVGQSVVRTPWLRSAFFSSAVADPRTISAELASRIVPQMASHGFITTLRAAAVAVGEVTVETVPCSTLVIWGARDRILPVDDGRKLASRIPDARFLTLPDVGHCPMLEVPSTFSRLVVDFASDPADYREGIDQRAEIGSPDPSTHWWRRRARSSGDPAQLRVGDRGRPVVQGDSFREA